MKGRLLSSLLSLTFLQGALACDPMPEWRPPTPESAFSNAAVVIHARVTSVQGRDPSHAKIELMQVLKGSFSGSTVRTASGALCGIGEFEVGKAYVFFFPSSDSWFVSHLVQPRGFTTEQTLKAITSQQLTPNPSIERTSPGKPGAASHVKR